MFPTRSPMQRARFWLLAICHQKTPQYRSTAGLMALPTGIEPVFPA